MLYALTNTLTGLAAYKAGGDPGEVQFIQVCRRGSGQHPGNPNG